MYLHEPCLTLLVVHHRFLLWKFFCKIFGFLCCIFFYLLHLFIDLISFKWHCRQIFFSFLNWIRMSLWQLWPPFYYKVIQYLVHILTESPVRTSFPRTTWSLVSDRNLNLITVDTPFLILNQVTEKVGLCCDTVMLFTSNKHTTDTLSGYFFTCNFGLEISTTTSENITQNVNLNNTKNPLVYC